MAGEGVVAEVEGVEVGKNGLAGMEESGELVVGDGE